jgi:hypothetical protein
MSATITLGGIETRIRVNHLNDNYSSSYRWHPGVVLRFIYDAIEEICSSMNPWASYDQSTGELLSPRNVASAKALGPDSADGDITTARAEVMPIDDRFEQAVIHIAAAKCLMIDDSDILNMQKAGTLYEAGGRFAQS